MIQTIGYICFNPVWRCKEGLKLQIPELDITAELLLPWICEACEVLLKNIKIHSSLSSILSYIKSINLIVLTFISVVIML